MNSADDQASTARKGAKNPVRRGHQTPGVRDALQQDIECGRLSPGTVLDERSLAAQFGVSRTPVREALRQLAVAGLVKTTPHAGAHVARKSIAEVRAMLEYLSEMEPICAKLAARRVGPALRNKFELALADCRTHAQEGLGYGEANARFHEVIYEGCHNSYLADQIRMVRRQLRMYHTHQYQSQSQINRSLEEHQQITRAILAGDEKRAAEAMMKHLPAGSSGFSEFLAQVPLHFFNHEPPAQNQAL